ncbi:MAG TPA: histidine triad nucleotide-binding protein [Deltaproteobacteria bacterium]|nr:histidine triad nucleotide-binding protein [Deltaproteobacteria bacterium]
MDCIFCKIAAKEMSSTIIDETDDMIVVQDINPQAPTHVLVIPKTHYSTLLDCEDRSLLGEMLKTASRVARDLGIDERGFRVVVNTNDEGGQTVRHLHMHVLAGRPLSGNMG